MNMDIFIKSNKNNKLSYKSLKNILKLYSHENIDANCTEWRLRILNIDKKYFAEISYFDNNNRYFLTNNGNDFIITKSSSIYDKFVIKTLYWYVPNV